MRQLAWVVLGLHVDLRRRIGKVEAERGGEGGAEGSRLLLVLLVQVLRGMRAIVPISKAILFRLSTAKLCLLL